MKTIRNGAFETNSSSTHTLTMMTKTDFDLWKSGKLSFDNWTDKLVPNLPVDPNATINVDEYDRNSGKWTTITVPDTPENREEYSYWDDNKHVYTYEEYERGEFLTAEFKTPSGIVVAISKYTSEG